MSELISTVSSSLGRLGVPDEMIRDAVALLPSGVTAVLVYGSRARGDHVRSSDLDLLALTDVAARTDHRGAVSLSFYTLAQMRTGIGSLFGAHLARDGVVIWDQSGALKTLVSSFGRVDTQRVSARALHFSQVLGALDVDLPKYLPGLLREAKYLLRSCLYSDAIAEGRPCFSVRELADRHKDPGLVELLSSRPTGDASAGDLDLCLSWFERLVGAIPKNPHGSLEALVVNEWGKDSELVAMALLALGGGKMNSDYTEVSKVLL